VIARRTRDRLLPRLQNLEDIFIYRKGRRVAVRYRDAARTMMSICTEPLRASGSRAMPRRAICTVFYDITRLHVRTYTRMTARSAFKACEWPCMMRAREREREREKDIHIYSDRERERKKRDVAGRYNPAIKNRWCV